MSAIINFYNEYFVGLRDPRTENWFLLGNPLKVFALIGFYLYFSLNLGPKLMKNRKPFVLKNIIIIYNIIQVVVNYSLVILGVYLCWLFSYNLFECKPPDLTDSYVGKTEYVLCYVYYMLKVLDLCDTIFFVLRKKWNQVTFLHVYHHAVLVISGYSILSYFPGSSILFVGFLNAVVHIVMYTYYAIALITQKEPWWKKHLTKMQLIQFAMLVVHSANMLRQGYCGGAAFWMVLLFGQNIFFLYLFGSFYIKSYVKKKN